MKRLWITLTWLVFSILILIPLVVLATGAFGEGAGDPRTQRNTKPRVH